MHCHRSAVAPRRAALLAVAVVALAVPSARAAVPPGAAKHPYVVMLTDNQPPNARAVASDHSRRFGVSVKMIYDRLGGYAGSMTDQAARSLAHEPGVLLAPDTAVNASEAPGSPEAVDTAGYAAPPLWGLDRIDQHPSLTTYPEKNRYHYTETGAGVTAYVIDTGVRTTHQEFSGGRATAGYDALGTVGSAVYGQDCNGHGTHVAGILGGRTFGVAKQVDIVSVRVLDCNGSGTVSNVVAGINWVTDQYKNHNPTHKPAVANMSLGGSTNTALDKAVQDSITAGVTYSIAAGNGNILGNGTDACTVSPARVPAALTVGATDSTDKRTTWSNYGSCVDVFAPGNNIVSSYGATGSNDSSWAQLSGTSMAAPAVAGVAALLLQLVPAASPAQVSAAVAGLATPNVVTGTNTAGAKLLFAPWQDSDINSARTTLTSAPVQSPPPPPPPRCYLFCGLFG